ncbi:unnamed protein product [Parnassius apollo]|uniref:(apollo) hypothetical protein n=1 Tax=Parnassius apollo TaxID=110799 RepID=A0A8S3WDV5_PARAO|nr:unnamed protein product [Parnassius apollo]
MNQRSKNLVLLPLSNGNQNSVEVQNLANSTRMPCSEHTLSHHTNSEKQVTPANLDDLTTTTPEQNDTTLGNPSNSPSILYATNETNERNNIDFPTGDFSGTYLGDDPRARSSSSSSSRSSSSCSSSSSSSGNSSSSSSDTPAENNNSNNESLFNGHNQTEQPITKPRGRKRTRNPTTWKKNVAKRLKNSGQTYISVNTKKLNQGKTMGPSCTSKCWLSCAAKFTEQKRTEIFKSYWKLESVERQRGFLNACTRILKCAYRRIKTNKMYDRKENTAYYLLNENKEIRVCKTFLINTLGITQQIIRTVIDGKARNDGFTPPDQRGKHGKQCKLQPEVIQAVKDHIESIPKVESHYLRANTSRQFIDGGLTVAALHRNYSEIQKQQNKPIVNYDVYSRIFNQDFNIGFFKPKKDRCDECEAYENASEVEKNKLRESFNLHQEEKSLSRHEKDRDMKRCHEPDNNTIVFTYDLQAVLPCPVGKSSSFYYKSRLNCYNLTISNANKRETTCYFWHEGLGNRGAIEIGSCVYKYLQQIAFEKPGCDVIIYSDNCCGQQKNRFVFAMYYYISEQLKY